VWRYSSRWARGLSRRSYMLHMSSRGGLGQLQAQSRTGAPQVFAPEYRSNDLESVWLSRISSTYLTKREVVLAITVVRTEYTFYSREHARDLYLSPYECTYAQRFRVFAEFELLLKRLYLVPAKWSCVREVLKDFPLLARLVFACSPYVTCS
jgi:hypothetical protein